MNKSNGMVSGKVTGQGLTSPNQPEDRIQDEDADSSDEDGGQPDQGQAPQKHEQVPHGGTLVVQLLRQTGHLTGLADDCLPACKTGRHSLRMMHGGEADKQMCDRGPPCTGP